ncbi:hypothetical protein BJX62DRAFT_24085 [Aspergillus germanicus]
MLVCPGRILQLTDLLLSSSLRFAGFDLVLVAKEGCKMLECRPHVFASISSSVGDLAIGTTERQGADGGNRRSLWFFVGK